MYLNDYAEIYSFIYNNVLARLSFGLVNIYGKQPRFKLSLPAYLVGGAQVLKSVLRVGIALVFVRMVLFRQLPVRFLNLILSSTPRNAQDFVKIPPIFKNKG